MRWLLTGGSITHVSYMPSGEVFRCGSVYLVAQYDPVQAGASPYACLIWVLVGFDLTGHRVAASSVCFCCDVVLFGLRCSMQHAEAKGSASRIAEL